MATFGIVDHYDDD